MLDLNQPVVRSVATELPSPETLPPQPAPGPTLVPPPPKRSRKKLWIIAGVALLIVIAATAIALSRRSKAGPVDTIRTATVVRHEFLRTLRVNGTVEATESYIVSAPTLTGGNLNSLIITHLATSGQPVKKGDLIVEFDRQGQIKNALDKQAEYRDLEEQIKKKAAEQAIARAKDETELHQAEDAVSAAEWETRRNEVVSKIDAEKNLANLEEARAKLKQLQQTFQLKRQAARAELRVLEIQRDRAHSAMLHAESNAKRMEVRAPMDGTVVLNAIWKGGQSVEVIEGDEIRSGQPFMQVMNPQSMQVRSRVNQADVGWIRAGEPVQVRLDAYPGLVLPGRVERVAAVGLTSGMNNKVRTFTAVFTIQGSDPKLMPDLTAAVDTEIERIPNALIIPRDALMNDAGGAYVWVQRGQSFEREPVKVAAVSDTEAALESGVDAGAVVLRNASARKRIQ